ncbi:MAG TPA: hypothetical protein VFG04_03865 [Planctomycetaceae bacterium]|jgi:hypothetical protein|nr:hypothetical protein [Planctomycetaceae bacterium]
MDRTFTCPNCYKPIDRAASAEYLFRNECCWCGGPLDAPQPVEEFAELPPTCFVEADPPEPKPKQRSLALRITGKVLFWLLSLVIALVVIAAMVFAFIVAGSLFGVMGVFCVIVVILLLSIASAIGKLTKAIEKQKD